MKKKLKKINLKKSTVTVLGNLERKMLLGGITGKPCFVSRYPQVCD